MERILFSRQVPRKIERRSQTVPSFAAVWTSNCLIFYPKPHPTLSFSLSHAIVMDLSARRRCVWYLNHFLTDRELCLEFFAILQCNMRFLQGSSSFSLAFFQSESRFWLCACVSLFLSLSLQLLVVSFIVYWQCGCMCDCDPELVKEYPGSWVVMIQHESEGNWKRGPHSTDLLQNTPLLSHVSISFGFLTDLTTYFVLGSDLHLWPDVGLFFLRRWILTWLLFFWFLLTWTATTQRSPEEEHSHDTMTHEWGTVCGRNWSGFQKKDQGENRDSRRKWHFLSKVFVTNLQFDQVRFFWVTEVSVFFLLFRCHTSSTIFAKHCECIAQKCTHLERLPPLASHLLLPSHCVLTRHGGKKVNYRNLCVISGSRTPHTLDQDPCICRLCYSNNRTQWVVPYRLVNAD